MRAILCAAALALATATAGAAEDTNSANYWLPHCKAFITANGITGSQAFCAGLVTGVAYAGCSVIPRGVSTTQVVLVVIRYIEARPQRMHEKFEYLALEAIRDAWSCKP